MATLAERLAQGAARASEKSYQTKDTFGFGKGVLIQNLPFPEARIKNGDHSFDIVAYEAGDNDPHNEKGAPVYYYDCWVHMSIGPNNDSYVCLARQFNKPCYPCIHRDMMVKNGADEEDVKKLYASRRCFYYIILYDTPQEEAKGPQITQLSHHLFEKQLAAQSKNPTKLQAALGEFIAVASPLKGPRGGRTIHFTHTGKGANTRIEGLRLIERDYVIPDEILEMVNKHPIDSLIHIPSYEEVKEVFLAGLAPSETNNGIAKPEEKATFRSFRNTQANTERVETKSEPPKEEPVKEAKPEPVAPPKKEQAPTTSSEDLDDIPF
jgi:hypothetical protein